MLSGSAPQRGKGRLTRQVAEQTATLYPPFKRKFYAALRGVEKERDNV
jgi:hypothetical protein